MAVNAYPYRWGLDEFLRVWEAGAFSKRTELLDGEVWAVPMGRWHGATTMRIVRALPNGKYEITGASLASGESLPEPDCWVLRSGAQPVAQLSRRMPRWAAADVMLVVEVSDETRDYDLGRKANLYAESGFPHYWSVTREGIYAHTDPAPAGYRQRTFHPLGERIPVPYVDGVDLAVDELISTED